MNVSVTELEKRHGTTNPGHDYEAKLSALVTLNCLFNENITNFWCLNNAHNVGGDLDDFVLSTEDVNGKKNNYFVQLKHHVKHVFPPDLLRHRDIFSLSKYARSYEEIKRSCGNGIHRDVTVENSVFILYTNAKFIDRPRIHNLKCNVTTGPDFFMSNKEGVIFQFQSDMFDWKFLKNFYFYTCQISETELQHSIKEKLCNRFGNVDDSVVAGIIDYFTSWIKSPKSLQLWKKYVEGKLLELLLLQYVPLPVPSPTEVDDLIMKTFLNFKDTIIPYRNTVSTGYLWSPINRAMRTRYGNEIDIFSWSTVLTQTLKDSFYSNKTMRNIFKRKLLNPQYLTVRHLMVAMWDQKEVPLIITYSSSTKPVVDETLETFKHLLKEKTVILLVTDANYADNERHNMNFIDKDLLDQNLNKMTLSLQGKERINLAYLNVNEDVLQSITPTLYVKLISGNFQIGQPSLKLDSKILKIIPQMLNNKILDDDKIELFCLNSPSNFHDSRLKCVESFKDVVSSATKSTHVAKFIEDGLFEWIYSVGPIKDIQQYIVDDTEPRKMSIVYNKKDDLMRESVKIFSTTLQQHKTEEIFGNYWSPAEWIVNIDLNDRKHKEYFKRSGTNTCIDYFLDCTIEGVDEEEFCRRLFKFFVSEGKMTWIVHNFHKIEEYKYSSTVKQQLKEATLKGIKLVIIVPARRKRLELEEFFNVFTTKISDQKIVEVKLVNEQ